ncbi:DNA cytosine methyltransferase [Arcobacter vandammei]|uniref:DNA cytosine methyltransferase n=1 Tax=Arcobacter vandammei TaxID=2782243 RepID=UPI0018DFFB94|nr:DNA cytosine methyltransferase [Arcobacter vandammei]
MKKIKVFEGFAGYGGASFGLKRAKIPHEIIGFSEIDKFAIELYSKNFPNIKSYGDITQIKPEELPDFDLFTGGFPCQPFSQVGLGKGEEDTRGTLFHNILEICTIKRPKHVLLENVKGLITKRHEKTLNTIIKKLEQLGYQVTYKLLNSKDYGIPQNRERVWIYAFHGKLDSNFKLEPKKEELTTFFKDLLCQNPPNQLFKTPEQIKRLKELYNLDFIVEESSCADLYNKKIRTDGISITILEPHHNKMRVVHPPINGKLQVRNYSIPEHYRLMGFKDGEIDFANQSYQQLCKRAANGWDINLVSKLFKIIFKGSQL